MSLYRIVNTISNQVASPRNPRPPHPGDDATHPHHRHAQAARHCHTDRRPLAARLADARAELDGAESDGDRYRLDRARVAMAILARTQAGGTR